MARVTFSEEDHCYRDLQGRIIPGVSYMLKQAGKVPDRPYTPEAAQFGKDVHAAIHLLEEASFQHWPDNGRVEEYLEGYRLFKADTGWQRLVGETILFHAGYRFAGRIDQAGTRRAFTRYMVLDVKSGSHEDWHVLQRGLYALALADELLLDPSELDLGGLYLRSRGYSLEVEKNPRGVLMECKAIAHRYGDADGRAA